MCSVIFLPALDAVLGALVITGRRTLPQQLQPKLDPDVGKPHLCLAESQAPARNRTRMHPFALKSTSSSTPRTHATITCHYDTHTMRSTITCHYDTHIRCNYMYPRWRRELTCRSPDTPPCHSDTHIRCNRKARRLLRSVGGIRRCLLRTGPLITALAPLITALAP